MSIAISRLMTTAEYTALENEAVANGYYRNDRRILTPGMAWYTDFIYDPTGARERNHQHVMITLANKGNHDHLSQYYWQDWAHIRPPICVVCPNGELWEIDRRSKFGPGWKVTGEGLQITCHPSINVAGYHGWLKNGMFSHDLEGRGPNGQPRK